MFENQNVGVNLGLNSAIDALTFSALPDALGIVNAKLQQIASNSDLFSQVFGEKANTAEILSVRKQWAIGDFSQLPTVQILSAADMNGTFGAYANSTQTVYLSDILFQSNAAPTNSLFGVVGVLVEETFHWIDDSVGNDTEGDEGELARNLVFSVNQSTAELTGIKSEDDSGVIVVNGQYISVEQNDTLATAQNLGTLWDSTIPVTGAVTYVFPNDYYRFQVNNTAKINLKLENLSTDIDLYLLNSNGTIITSSQNSYTSNENISRQLNAGTYYIQVKQFSGFSSFYSLSVDSTVAPVDNAGNFISTARNIGTLGTSNSSYGDWVGWADSNDYYRFDLNGTRDLRLSLTGLTGDADVEVLNSSGAVIGSSRLSGTNQETINLNNLGSGTYYTRVYNYNGANAYYGLSLRGEIPEPPWNVMSGSAKDIDIGNDGSIWVIGTNPVAGGYGIYRWTDAGWQGVDGGAVRIAVQPNGVPWVVNDSGYIFRWDGGNWNVIPGRAKDIDIGSDGSVWAIGTNPVAGGYGIYKWNGTGWNGIDGGGVIKSES